MTLKTEFMVIWFLHYISIIPMMPKMWLRSSNQNVICKLDAAQREEKGKGVSAGLRNQTRQAMVMHRKMLN